MKRKNIDAMREVRLWTRDIVIPGVAVGVMLWTNDEVRKMVKHKCKDVSNKVKSKFVKKEDESKIVVFPNKEDRA
ncbi:hypothetical protein ACYSNL_02085 [Enterococcus cecorum]